MKPNIKKANVVLPPQTYAYFNKENLLYPFEKYLDDLFNDSFPDIGRVIGHGHFFSSGAYPKVDVLDYPNKIEIIAEIAGYKKENIDVSIDNGMLTISGKSNKEEKFDANVNHLMKELKRSQFSRTFSLDDSALDVNSVDAKFENGLLTVTIMKYEAPKVETKKVEIK